VSVALVVLHLRAQGLGEEDEHPSMLSYLYRVTNTKTMADILEGMNSLIEKLQQLKLICFGQHVGQQKA